MGEFINIPSISRNPYSGKMNEVPSKVYLQFVPGMVLDVVLSEESPAWTEPRDINSIIAQKHVGESFNSKKATRTRYYPLFRGMVDTPIKGDGVLLCEIGGVSYYLGPLNSLNSPNFNIDTAYEPFEPKFSNNQRKDKVSNQQKFRIPDNYMLAPLPRLQKIYKRKLDDPKDNKKGEEGSIQKIDTHGDMLFEGRYGNSLRIGSRGAYPLMMISNGRNPSDGRFENSFDGSLISITSAGSLLNHYEKFVLASDSIEENTRLVAGGNDSEETEKFNYDYGEENDKVVLANQIFLNSDKITLNARQNNITLSSLVNLDFGAGNNLTINTKNYTSIESSNIYLGKQAIEQKEPLVLGEQLKIILEELVGVVETLKVTGCIAGMSGPIDPATTSKISQLKNKLSNPSFFSEYHFIEDNGQKSD